MQGIFLKRELTYFFHQIAHLRPKLGLEAFLLHPADLLFAKMPQVVAVVNEGKVCLYMCLFT